MTAHSNVVSAFVAAITTALRATTPKPWWRVSLLPGAARIPPQHADNTPMRLIHAQVFTQMLTTPRPSAHSWGKSVATKRKLNSVRLLSMKHSKLVWVTSIKETPAVIRWNPNATHLHSELLTKNWAWTIPALKFHSLSTRSLSWKGQRWRVMTQLRPQEPRNGNSLTMISLLATRPGRTWAPWTLLVSTNSV